MKWIVDQWRGGKAVLQSALSTMSCKPQRAARQLFSCSILIGGQHNTQTLGQIALFFSSAILILLTKYNLLCKWSWSTKANPLSSLVHHPLTLLTGVWFCPDLCSFLVYIFLTLILRLSKSFDNYHVCEDTNWTQALSFRWHRFCCCWWCWRVKVSQPIRDSRVSEAGRANLRNKTDRSCLWRRHLQWRQQELRFVPPVGFLCNLNNSNRALYTCTFGLVPMTSVVLWSFREF